MKLISVLLLGFALLGLSTARAEDKRVNENQGQYHRDLCYVLSEFSIPVRLPIPHIQPQELCIRVHTDPSRVRVFTREAKQTKDPVEFEASCQFTDSVIYKNRRKLICEIIQILSTDTSASGLMQNLNQLTMIEIPVSDEVGNEEFNPRSDRPAGFIFIRNEDGLKVRQELNAATGQKTKDEVTAGQRLPSP